MIRAINKFTIPFTYYVPLSQVSYRPYLGAFYSHTLMGDNDGYSIEIMIVMVERLV